MDHKNLVLAERDLLPAGGVGYAFDIVVLILTLNFGMGGAVLVADDLVMRPLQENGQQF